MRTLRGGRLHFGEAQRIAAREAHDVIALPPDAPPESPRDLTRLEADALAFLHRVGGQSSLGLVADVLGDVRVTRDVLVRLSRRGLVVALDEREVLYRLTRPSGQSLARALANAAIAAQPERKCR